MAAFPSIIANRYLIDVKIGSGGMGTVYRALDRLTGNIVALKLVNVPDLPAAPAVGGSDIVRLALATEFRTLATLRHPNIISVLDYGFDLQKQPYITMEFLAGGQNIIHFAQNKPLPTKLELLVQLLQALLYLHRHGIIHRDLKPDNVMVSDGQVKVLDFGLAVAREYSRESDELIGTIAYLAPEVITSGRASEASDLYAVGLIAYQVFAGTYPFDVRRDLLSQILTSVPDIASLKLDPQLGDALTKLLAKSPSDRFSDAGELIRIYAQATHQESKYESVLIRDSFLQAARFVGREAEIKLLTDAIRETSTGSGSAWLIAGESGVGKSRLMEEVRTQALISGVMVLRGYAVREEGAPYQAWREVLRPLCLSVDLTPFQASVLKDLLPDIHVLLRKDVAPAQSIDLQSAQNRLLGVIQEMVLAQQQPMLIQLEDVQWAGSESIGLLKRLAQNCRHVMLVASYRHDEAPKQIEELTDFRRIKLQRLRPDDISALSESMLGQTGRRNEIVNLLERESEGNVFFIIEVVRSLWERSGSIDELSQITLPAKVFAGGVQAVIQGRLTRIPHSARPLLEIAAVAGRRLNLELLRHINATDGSSLPDLDEWLLVSTNLAVLDVQDGGYRFSHDKMREGLIEALSAADRQRINRVIAESLEVLYPNDDNLTHVLAYHWREAGDPIKEFRYARRSGELSLRKNASLEAIAFLERALVITGSNTLPTVEIAELHHLLGEAQYLMGQFANSREHLEAALALVGAARSFFPAIVGQVFVQLGHRLLPYGTSRRAREKLIAARACERLAQIAYIDNDKIGAFFHSLQGLNLSEVAGNLANADQARFYGTMVLAMGAIPLHAASRIYLRLAERTTENLHDSDARAWVKLVIGIYNSSLARWYETRQVLEQAAEIAEEIGSVRRWSEATEMLSYVAVYTANWSEATAASEALYQRSMTLGDSPTRVRALAQLTEVDIRLGRFKDALGKALEAKSLVSDLATRVNNNGQLLRIHVRMGNLKEAEAFALSNVALIAPSAPTISLTAEGYSAVAEYYMTRWKLNPTPENRSAAKSACGYLLRFARIFDIGKPIAFAYQSAFLALDQQPDKAAQVARQGIDAARAAAMPYEEGISHVMLAHALQNPAQREAEMQTAYQIFHRLGAPMVWA